MPEFPGWLNLLKQPSSLLPLGAVVAGAAAALGAGHFVEVRAAAAELQVQSRYAPRAVVVASRDVDRGQVLDSSTLAVRQMPQAFLPPDAMPPSRAAELIGRLALVDVRRGTPVVPSVLHSTGTEALAARLAPGHRALTIQVDEVNSLSGRLRVGDHVDLLFSDSESSVARLVPLLEGVRILATGDVDERQGSVARYQAIEPFNTVTLLVTADEAARIVLAEQTGRITVLLRGEDDEAPLGMSMRDSRELLQAGRRAPGTSRVELLTGGLGEAQPSRTWLRIGGVARPSGEAL